LIYTIKSSEVKAGPPAASLPFKGQVTEQATVKWSTVLEGNAVYLLAQGRVGNIPSKLSVETSHALRAFLVVLVATNNERQNQGAISTVKLLPKFQSNVHVDPIITSPAVFAYSSHVLYAADKCFKIIAEEAKEPVIMNHLPKSSTLQLI